MLRNRYPGVQPFKTSDRDLFFGRDADIDNLHDFLMLEKLVVLFGKSGYGKSSLLSAGIVPRLTDPAQPASFQFAPISVRFGVYAEGQSFSPLETTRKRIEALPPAADLDFLPAGDSLWSLLKQRQHPGQAQFVLLFDQFEEFFSYPAEQQQAFRRQLAELLYTTLPAGIREQLDRLDADQLRRAVQPLPAKALLSIRSDRMSLLDSMKDVLPAILHKRYELKPLRPAQAREAMVQPALLGQEAPDQPVGFHSPPFEYTPAALDRIERELGASAAGGIEAFQLQIVCAEIEKAVRQGRVPDRDANGLPDVDLADLPDFHNLYETYYRSRLDEIPAAQRLAAQRVLEDGLLTSDPATGEGRRMSVDGRALIGQFAALGLSEELLRQLARSYLIRREVNTVGGFSYEISHDTLVAPVQQAKATRLAAEAQAAARQRIRRLAGIVAVVLLLLIGAVSLTAYAFQQQAEAEAARGEAEARTQEALTAQAAADSLRVEVELRLRIANQALLETNEEKRNSAARNLREREQALIRYRALFGDMPDQIRRVEQEVAQVRRERDRYQDLIDSLTNTLHP
jgi:hypothetical protein